MLSAYPRHVQEPSASALQEDTVCAEPCLSWTSRRGIHHWGKAHWWDPSAQRGPL